MSYQKCHLLQIPDSTLWVKITSEVLPAGNNKTINCRKYDLGWILCKYHNLLFNIFYNYDAIFKAQFSFQSSKYEYTAQYFDGTRHDICIS